MRTILLAALVAACASTAVLSQTPAAPPGAPLPGALPGAQRPGMPPRDNVAQAPQTGTARLRGRVVAAETGEPLRRAQVTVNAPDIRQMRATTTDGDGRYEFQDLPAGRYTLSVSKGGYVTLQYGQRRPYEAGTPVEVADGVTIDRLDVALPRGSVIAVRITDEFGEPIAGAMVSAQRFQWGPDGQRRLTSAPSATPFGPSTDDRGDVRIFGLMPGDYAVSANVRNLSLPGTTVTDESEGIVTTYYPGTTSPNQAQTISVGLGQETAVSFAMAVSRLARISGTVVDSDGRPAAGASLTLVTRFGSVTSSRPAGTVGPDGGFTVTGVSLGEHTLTIRPQVRPGAGAVAETASIDLDVTGDISDLHLMTSRGAVVSGRVVFEGTSARDWGTVTSPRVQALPASGVMSFMTGISDPLANGTIGEDGRFELAGVSGRVFFNTPAPRGWILTSVTLDGDDVTDVPLDMTGRGTITGLVLTLSDQLTNVSGRVADGGREARDYVVVIQPAQPLEQVAAARLVRVVRPDTNGRFETRGLRPGRYIATALDAVENGRQFSPEFREQIRPLGQEFTLRDGESATVDLRLVTGL